MFTHIGCIIGMVIGAIVTLLWCGGTCGRGCEQPIGGHRLQHRRLLIVRRGEGKCIVGHQNAPS